MLAWSEEAHKRNVHLLAYNTRFLILLVGSRSSTWFSHVLGRMAELVPARPAAALRPSYLLVGDVRRYFALSRDLLSRGQLAGHRHDGGARTSCTDVRTDATREADAGLATSS